MTTFEWALDVQTDDTNSYSPLSKENSLAHTGEKVDGSEDESSWVSASVLSFIADPLSKWSYFLICKIRVVLPFLEGHSKHWLRQLLWIKEGSLSIDLTYSIC